MLPARAVAPTTRELSIILPCYAASDIALRSLVILREFLDGQSLDWEVIVVDDGGNRFDPSFFVPDSRIRLVRHPKNLGKGAAVRTGMMAAGGAVRIYTDVDLPYDCELLVTMTRYIQRGFHVVIGDRTMPGSSYAINSSVGRRMLSKWSSFFIGSLVTGGFHDTQCGIKAFRGDIAEELFRLVTIQRFAFDIELIYIALKHRLDIKRMPVQLRRNETSSVRPWRDGLTAFRDVLTIKANQLGGRYESEVLDTIVLEEIRRCGTRSPTAP